MVLYIRNKSCFVILEIAINILMYFFLFELVNRNKSICKLLACNLYDKILLLKCIAIYLFFVLLNKKNFKKNKKKVFVFLKMKR